MSLLRRIEQEKRTSVQDSAQMSEMQVRRQPSPARDAYTDLKSRIQNKLIAELDPTMDVTRTDEVRRTIEGALRSGQISLEESARLRKRFEQGLQGYTYLTRDD